MGGEDDSGGEGGPPPEKTEEELEERQERELEELEEKCKAHLEKVKADAGKGKKAKAALDAAEREVEQWQYELRERHGDELQRLRDHLEGGAAPAAAPEAAEKAAKGAAAAAAAEESAETEEDKIRRKKDKALKKRQGRAAKEAEREAEIEREKREAGPSARALELAALLKQLAKCEPPLRVLEVAADGHCLYRAVGDQLRRVRPEAHQWRKPPEQAHEELRALCAKALLKRPDDYAAFAELKDGEDFKAYCGRVEHSADWGGELELRALADCLGVQILVHRANEPRPLEIGQGGGAPLQVTYHQHYYSLGEHYNSAVPIGQ